MSEPPQNTFSILTERLRIRSWRDADREPYAAINADPNVREFLGNTLTRTQSDKQIAGFDAHELKHGFTFWAIEIPSVAPCIGFVGLERTDYSAHFTPAIEIGWRLDRTYWGRGYAIEGALAVLQFAFVNLAIDEVVAVTVPMNIKSRSVMTKLGMTYSSNDDFDNPEEKLCHPLRRSVLYRISKTEFVA